MTSPGRTWARAMLAVTLLAVGGARLNGMVVRARAGPVRQAFEDALQHLPGPLLRIHPSISDIQLFGGLDIGATLAGNAPLRQAGIAARPGLLLLPMAERTTPGLAARLSQLLDAGFGHRLILLDEGADPDELAPACLRERLAFGIDLDGIRWSDAPVTLPAPGDLDTARQGFDAVRAGVDHLSQLTAIAVQFGIESLRAPVLAARTARALAALDGRSETSENDVRTAAELVFAPRAVQLPALEEAEQPPDPDPAPSGDEEPADALHGDRALEDQVIEAVAAWVPADILERAGTRTNQPASFHGSGAGSKRKGNRRGRPLPPRPGQLDGRARIDIPATLLAAAPFQPFRSAGRAAGGARVVIHPSDIRLQRFEDHSDRLVIFAVDASGSTAMARMAEAKGAVETLLSRAYAKRDMVALVAFRKTGADVLLPPTRSLVQAKRRLAALPGGGGTPLAAGLMSVAEVAAQGQSRGLSPACVILTDGRANIGLDGTPGRQEARKDAQTAALLLRRLNFRSAVIDTAPRPGEDGARLAEWLMAHYIALPRADAKAISTAADAALGG